MKKISTLFLAVVLVLSLAACGGGKDNKLPSHGSNPSGTSQQEQDNISKDNPPPEGSDAEFTIVVDGNR